MAPTPPLPPLPKVFTGIAKGTPQGSSAISNLSAYPILTEEVGYPPSPLARPSSGGAGTGGSSGGGSSIGQTANQAISAVLGWKPRVDDPKAFVGALTQSFTLNYFEGHVESQWVPRSYAVQTDLSGGITGAQASLYARAQEALDQSLPLLDGLYALDPTAEQEDVTAYREVVRTQLMQLVSEFGFVGGPRVPRVNTYFQLILGPFTPSPLFIVQSNSDLVGGSLGQLRDLYGVYTVKTSLPPAPNNRFVNSIEDEQNTTNFRILSDYITSLAQSWINNYTFFGVNTTTPFFGTQLVLISRQLSVISEDVDEVRFTMDSVFIGPSERQTLQVNFGGGNILFFEDFAKWVQGFVADEAPPLIQQGGIYAVQNTVVPVVSQLQTLSAGVLTANNSGLPAGFSTPRVQLSLQQLSDDLQQLLNLASAIQ
jgi:hypothetical protein